MIKDYEKKYENNKLSLHISNSGTVFDRDIPCLKACFYFDPKHTLENVVDSVSCSHFYHQLYSRFKTRNPDLSGILSLNQLLYQSNRLPNECRWSTLNSKKSRVQISVSSSRRSYTFAIPKILKKYSALRVALKPLVTDEETELSALNRPRPDNVKKSRQVDLPTTLTSARAKNHLCLFRKTLIRQVELILCLACTSLSSCLSNRMAQICWTRLSRQNSRRPHHVTHRQAQTLTTAAKTNILEGKDSLCSNR